MRKPRPRNGGFTLTELRRFIDWPANLARELVLKAGVVLTPVTPHRNGAPTPTSSPTPDHRPRATTTRNYEPLMAEEAERVLAAYFERLGGGRVLARGKDGRFRPRSVAD